MKDKKVVFMGTPEFAVPILKSLIENTNVILVVTQPDKEVGRKKELKFSPIKEVALENSIEIYQPLKIRQEYKKVLETDADIIVTCAYGQIIPKELLEFPKYKAINVHASLLPKLRGGAPIHHAIIDGYEETGITIMYMDEFMDEGDIISQESIKIDGADNVGVLHDKLSLLGSELLIKTLPSIFDGTNKRIKQNNEEATYGYNIKRADELINFNKPAKDVFNQIRGLYPFPSGYITLNNEIIKVIDCYVGEDVDGNAGVITNLYKNGIGIKCEDKEIIITKLKPEGKKVMNTSDYLNGKKENILGSTINI